MDHTGSQEERRAPETDRNRTADLELEALKLLNEDSHLSASCSSQPYYNDLPSSSPMPYTGPQSLVHKFQETNSSKNPDLKSSDSQF